MCQWKKLMQEDIAVIMEQWHSSLTPENKTRTKSKYFKFNIIGILISFFKHLLEYIQSVIVNTTSI